MPPKKPPKIVEISQQMRTLTAVMIGLTVVHTLLAGYSLLT